MSDTPKILGRGAVHALTGLCFQILLSGLFMWALKAYSDTAAGHVLYTSLAGTIVWLHGAIVFRLLGYEARHEPRAAKNNRAGDTGVDTASAANPDRALFFHRVYRRIALPLMELGIAMLLVQSAFAWFGDESPKPPVAETNYLLLISLYSVITLVLIVFTVYLTALMRAKTWHLLKSGRNYTNLLSLMALCLLLNACCAHFGVDSVGAIIDDLFIILNTLLAAEILTAMVLRLFLPHRSGVLPRPGFDSYLLEGIFRPMRIGRIFSAMLESIFGFNVTRTSFGNIARALVLPAFFISTAVLFGLSSIVIVKPGEQGILLNFGRLYSVPLDPGLHLKLPWPLANVHHYDISEVKSIHVGSHKPKQSGGSVYLEGVPILWTNMHGISVDEPLICSSPRNLVMTVDESESGESAGRKAPSVSLAAADVHIQYVIDDLMTYVRATAAPEVFLEKIAEAQASRSFYRHDIDDLFCEARLSLIDGLRHAVQAGCDRHSLGIEIIHVAITAVHPPVDVAGAFEETVAAMQERETSIQYAGQAAVQSQVETTGSTEKFSALAALADRADSAGETDAAGHEDLLLQCGGDISRILAEAEAYRFSRENRERGKIERFGEQLRAFEASPRNYRYDRYFSILESGLGESKKVVLSKNADQVVVLMGLQENAGFESLFEETDEMSERSGWR